MALDATSVSPPLLLRLFRQLLTLLSDAAAETATDAEANTSAAAAPAALLDAAARVFTAVWERAADLKNAGESPTATEAASKLNAVVAEARGSMGQDASASQHSTTHGADAADAAAAAPMQDEDAGEASQANAQVEQVAATNAGDLSEPVADAAVSAHGVTSAMCSWDLFAPVSETDGAPASPPAQLRAPLSALRLNPTARLLTPAGNERAPGDDALRSDAVLDARRLFAGAWNLGAMAARARNGALAAAYMARALELRDLLVVRPYNVARGRWGPAGTDPAPSEGELLRSTYESVAAAAAAI
jgi:hypothetical protein